MSFRVNSPLARAAYGITLLSALCTWTACHNSNDPAPAPIGIADEPTVSTFGALPGVVVTIDKLYSKRGEDKAAVGDALTIEFTVGTEAGDPLELSTMARGGIMVSGPTFNYQRVIASQSDVIAKAVKIALGKYRYTFSEVIPATYIAPLNDTEDLTEGELTGQNLLSGTYTVGIELRKDYTVNGVTYRDPGNAAKDFLIGDATTIEPRQVVTLQNCNQCHGELRAHGDNRNNLVNCLLCHTAGAEDKNVPTAADGTPGIAIDFKVMIHKIHAGFALPSVNGVATNADGTRNYSATPKPYEIVGYGNSVIDFSEVAFPSWPAFTVTMPADIGALTTGSQESNIRKGPVDCAKCHGDPDGAGPLAAPAQGDLAYTQPSIQACGSCHDDWNPELPYTANGLTMPLQRDNAACKDCHRQSGAALDVVDAHRHPLTDPDFAHGVVVDIQDVVDVPMSGTGNGKFDAGDKVQVTMTIKDNAGNDIAVTDLYRLEVLMNGPTTNPNFMHSFRLPLDSSIGAGPVYTFNLPQLVYYDPCSTLADSGIAGQTFATSRAPHWNPAVNTTVMLRTGIAASTTTTADNTINQNYLDVTDSTGFVKNDYIVIEDASASRREYLKLQWVDGNRLWFSNPYSTAYAPSARFLHLAGSTVDKITKTDIASANYSVDAAAGTITETTEFGTGEVLVTYTSDYMVPEYYPGAIYDTPDLDQTWGDWVGLAVLPGTYNLSIQAAKTETFTVSTGGNSASTTYRDTSEPAIAHLLFGTADSIELVNRINDSSGCYNCHTDIAFHGGTRRGIEACLMCHGAAAGEDRPQYVSNTAAQTPEFTIDFRNLLHELHGAGFPYMPGQVQNCAACHGENNNAWVEPAPRNHPDATFATRSWRVACVSCHESDAEKAHMDVNTNAFGNEACAICHGVGEDKDLRTVHTVK